MQAFAILRRQVTQGEADAFQWLAKVLATVGCDQHGSRARAQQILEQRWRRLGGDPVQSIDAGVARDQDALAGHVLAQQVVSCPGSRCKVAIGYHARNAAIDLLWKRLPAIASAQARFDV